MPKRNMFSDRKFSLRAVGMVRRGKGGSGRTSEKMGMGSGPSPGTEKGVGVMMITDPSWPARKLGPARGRGEAVRGVVAGD